jgi:2-(1,2-epoxy-1,2-dihydrophenyl)acetyl-CoA isomerase
MSDSQPSPATTPAGTAALGPAEGQGKLAGAGAPGGTERELEAVSVTVVKGTATIELNRPQALNAWDAQLCLDLLEALRRVHQDEAVRAVVIAGAGRGFSSGADLREMTSASRAHGGGLDIKRALNERYNPIVAAVRELPKPVIAAVHGAIVGIGCSLALACDLVLAAESAYFLLAFVNIGLVPDGGASLFVPARIGLGRAAEMAMLGEPVGAQQAQQWGLVNRVVADERLRAEAQELAARLAAGPTLAYAAVKRELNASVSALLARQLLLEAELQQQLVGTHDFAEGTSAFLEKRPARFTGR